MSTEKRERPKGTLTMPAGTLSFVGGLVALAKRGDPRAIKKLEEVQAWLKSIVESF